MVDGEGDKWLDKQTDGQTDRNIANKDETARFDATNFGTWIETSVSIRILATENS